MMDNDRFRRLVRILRKDVAMFTVIGILLGAVVALAQSSSVSTTTENSPTTPWGDPDLQGVWTHGTITPLERPEEYGDRELLTEEEVAALNHASDTRADQREGLTAEQDVALAYNQFWWDRGISIGRTSLITDPSNGRLPPRLPEAERWATSAEAERRQGIRRGRLPAPGPEDMDLGDRCLVYRPVPITSSGYNNNVQIAQSPGYVAILQEQIHEVRIIPLDGRPGLNSSVDQWLGVSRGRWEGDTLVVETTNFRQDAEYLGSSSHRHVEERLTRMTDGTIRYTFTVTDPTVWTRSWTGMVPWRKTDGPIYEYACHEGNLGMIGILTGSRAKEAF